MRILSRAKAVRRGSTLVLFTLMLPTMLIPLAGLGIDATMLYIVQAKLAAAVDGAALGAGRLLGTLASPNEIAGEFLNANFRANGTAGILGSLQPDADDCGVPGHYQVGPRHCHGRCSFAVRSNLRLPHCQGIGGRDGHTPRFAGGAGDRPFRLHEHNRTTPAARSFRT